MNKKNWALLTVTAGTMLTNSCFVNKVTDYLGAMLKIQIEMKLLRNNRFLFSKNHKGFRSNW